MFTLKHRLEMFVLITTGTALSLFFLLQRNNNMEKRVFSTAAMNSIVSDSPTPVVLHPEVTSIMNSPDGMKSLTMIKEYSEGLSKYTFITTSPDTERIEIFTKKLEDSQNLSIPFNTWSPDNEYLFLTESTPTLNNYYVFSASGKLFSNSNPYVNIQELFLQKLPDYKIDDVTGWASSTLIVVNTSLLKNEQKVSFWFDVTNQSFIQLGTYFN